MMRFDLTNEAQTLRLGETVAACLRLPLVLFLKGELGAGKTTLMRALLKALGHNGRVKSPTYGIAETYQTPGGDCIHLDLYRIADPTELEYLGVLDQIDERTLLAVEWPEKGALALPKPDLVVTLSHAGAGRLAEIEARSETGELVFRSLLKSNL